MNRLVTVVICGLALAAAATAAGAPPIQLPALVRLASSLSGLEPKQRVHVAVVAPAELDRRAAKLLDRDYPRDQQDYDQTLYRALGLLEPSAPLRPQLVDRYVRGVRGLYDPFARRAYVRRGRGMQRAALHELVHALQDQRFDLRRVSALRRGHRDAAAAASAAVEGNATLSSAVLSGRVVTVPPPTVRSSTPLGLFLEIESAFPYATGTRFATSLFNVGGRSAALAPLRRFPETTEQVFHLDAFVTREQPSLAPLPAAAAGFSLTRQDTFGELDVRALLAVFQVPRLDRVGEGWGGGRTGIYDGGDGRAVALVLRWDERPDAEEWAEAVAVYVNEAFDADAPGFPATSPCGRATCWSVGDRTIGFARVGTRTALVFGRTVATSAALAGSLASD